MSATEADVVLCPGLVVRIAAEEECLRLGAPVVRVVCVCDVCLSKFVVRAWWEEGGAGAGDGVVI